VTQRQGPENVGEQGPPPRAWVASHYVREFADGVNGVVDDVMPSTEPVPGSRWSELDQAAQEPWARELCGLVWLEGDNFMVGMSHIVNSSSALIEGWDRYHDNLPFDAAVLRWLHDTYDSLDDSLVVNANVLRLIASQRDHIVNRGRLVEVNGAELIDRWWDWRRGVGDYAGRDAAGEAYEALRHVKDLATALASSDGQ
jgi:hypothetical protein